MSRLRDHRSRMDTSICPDPEGCVRLLHSNLTSGLAPRDTCECCGQVVQDDHRVPSAREWREAMATRNPTIDHIAALYNVRAANPPTSYLELVGWTMEYHDGSWGLHKIGSRAVPYTQPVLVRPLFAPKLKDEE